MSLCLEAEIQRLKDGVRQSEGHLEAAQRASKRQATPFSRGKRKPSGRRAGGRASDPRGWHGHRAVPERVDDEVVAELPATLGPA